MIQKLGSLPLRAASTRRRREPPRQEGRDAFQPGESPPVDLGKAMQVLQRAGSSAELRVRWTRDLGPRFHARPNVGPDGSVAVVNDDALIVLNPGGHTSFSVPKVENDVWPESYNPPVFSRSGTVIAPSYYGLLAYSPSGKVLWNHPLGKLGGSPSCDDQGNVYAATERGLLAAYDPDGKERWKTDLQPLAEQRWLRQWTAMCDETRAEIEAERDPERQERLRGVLQGTEGTLQQIREGQTGWKTELDAGPFRTREGNLLVSCKGWLQCLDPGGKPLWQAERSVEGRGFNQLPNGKIVFCNWSSCLEVIDPATGKLEWEYGAWIEKRLDRVPQEVADEARRSGNVGANTVPALSPDGKAIYFAGSDGKVRALTSEGERLWTAQMEGSESSGLGNYLSVDVGRDGTVYVAGSRGLQAFTSAGEPLWRYEVTGDREVMVRVQGDSIYLNTYAGRVHCLRADDLKRLSELDLRPDKHSRIAIADGFVIVGGVRVKRRDPAPAQTAS
ncbi:MAG: PQQ-binding-like beta-propeller repeat protein [Armatimonadetes bacterium]|nr:PQQ-binding-like beta-propeller repeat protein [Armatimonadota bacterium]